MCECHTHACETKFSSASSQLSGARRTVLCRELLIAHQLGSAASSRPLNNGVSILRLGESPDGDGDPIGAGGCWITRSFDTPRRQRGLGGTAHAPGRRARAGRSTAPGARLPRWRPRRLRPTPPGTLLVVLPNPSDVAPWTDDLASFMGVRPAAFEAWEGWPVPPNRGKLEPHPPLDFGSFSNSRTTRRRSSWRDGGGVPAGAAAGRPRRPWPERSRAGEDRRPGELAEWLVANGYKRVDAVEYPGEFARRGGICDIFPPDAPTRCGWSSSATRLESIRTFAVSSQRSLEKEPIVFVCLSVESGAPKPLGLSRRSAFSPTTFPRFASRPRRTGRPEGAGPHFFDRVADPTGLFTADGGVRQPAASCRP